MLQETKKFITLYFITLLMQLKADMGYKFDFINEVIRVLLGISAVIVLVQIIFLNTNSVEGVSKNEMYLLFGMFSLSFTIYRVIFGNLGEIAWGIKDGYFDSRLSKPFNTLLSYTFFNSISYSIPDVVQNIGLITYAFLLGASVNILELLLCLVLSMALYFSTYLFFQTLNFYTLFPENATNLSESIFQVARLPLNFHPPVARILLSYILPFGITGAYAIYANATYLPKYLYLNISVAIVALVYLSIKFWNYSLRKYTGASS